jgi:hypothetical protein
MYEFLLYIYLHNYVCTNMCVLHLNYLIVSMNFVVSTQLCMYLIDVFNNGLIVGLKVTDADNYNKSM